MIVTIKVDTGNASREALACAYKMLGGKGYSDKWKDSTLTAKLEGLAEAEGCVDEPVEVTGTDVPLNLPLELVEDLSEATKDAANEAIAAGLTPTEEQRAAVEAFTGPLDDAVESPPSEPVAPVAEPVAPVAEPVAPVAEPVAPPAPPAEPAPDKQVLTVVEEEPQPAISPDLDDEDVIEFMVQHQLHRTVTPGDRSTMCLGLAFLPGAVETSGDVVFAADNGSRWVSLAFLPRGYMREKEMKDLWYMQTRTTTVMHGLPQVGPGKVKAQHEFTGTDVVATSEGTFLGTVPLSDRRLVRTMIDLTWGMECTGFRCRRAWETKRDNFIKFMEDPDGMDFRVRRRYARWAKIFQRDNGRAPSQQERRDHMFCFGGEASVHEDMIHTKRWMPAPLLAFREELREHLFNLCTLQEMEDGTYVRAMPFGLLNRFLEDVADHDGVPVHSPCNGTLDAVYPMGEGSDRYFFVDIVTEDNDLRRLRVSTKFGVEVHIGDEVGVGQLVGIDKVFQPSEDFVSLPDPQRARRMRMALGGESLDAIIADWFQRQLLELRGGVVHAPAVIASVASRRSMPAGLLWDLRPCQDFYVDESDAFILPTLNERKLGNHRAVVRDAQHEFSIDLTPQDDRFMEVPCRWWELSKRNTAKTARMLQNPGEARQYREAAKESARLAMRTRAEYTAFVAGQIVDDLVARAATKEAMLVYKIVKENEAWDKKLSAEFEEDMKRREGSSQLVAAGS